MIGIFLTEIFLKIVIVELVIKNTYKNSWTRS